MISVRIGKSFQRAYHDIAHNPKTGPAISGAVRAVRGGCREGEEAVASAADQSLVAMSIAQAEGAACSR